MSSKFYGMQYGTQLEIERRKSSGGGVAILSVCPICNGNRRLGDHRKCSREMQRRNQAGEL